MGSLKLLVSDGNVHQPREVSFTWNRGSGREKPPPAPGPAEQLDLRLPSGAAGFLLEAACSATGVFLEALDPSQGT